MKRAAHGVTLLELMIASAIAAVIAIGLGTIEGSRARMTEEIRRQAGLMEPERKNAALAAVHIAKDLETADLYSPSSGTVTLLNVRIPDCTTPPTCSLDLFASYQWVQYRRTVVGTTNELRMYRFPRTLPWPPASCPTAQVLAREVTALSFTPTNNGATYSVTWTSGTRSQTFQGNVIARFRPDQTGFTGGLDASGAVSLPPGISCP